MITNWLTLYYETFLWINDTEGLVYNSNCQKGFKFDLSSRISILCRELLIISNLYTIRISQDDFKDTQVKKWLDKLINEFDCGCIINCSEKPVSLKPILKLLENKDHYYWLHNNGVGGKIMQNLQKLTVYINSSEFGSNDLYKQVRFPLKNFNEINYDKLMCFIKQCQFSNLSEIHIVGNIFSFSLYDTLLNEISNYKFNIVFHILLQDFLKYKDDLIDYYYENNIHFNILIDSTHNISFNDLPENNERLTVSLLTDSKSFIDRFYSLKNDYSLFNNVDIIPIYNGCNLNFFEKYVYTNTEDLEHRPLTKKDIFINQIININYFGELTILPDGSVFSNVNTEQIGTIDDSAYSIIYKELTTGNSWFSIRKIHPCNKCIYQWLCPPPSNYEKVLNKPNLCNIFQSF